MILVTGGTGFIGSHLIRKLIEQYGKSRIVSFSSNDNHDCHFLHHKNYEFDKDYFLQAGYQDIEVIFHLGAFIPKSKAEVDDIDGSLSNIINTRKLISAELPNIKKIVFASTIDVYPQSGNINELTRPDPWSLYGQSKLFCEKMIYNWANATNIQTLTARIGHTFGPGSEGFKKLIPTTIQKMLRNEPIAIYGSPSNTRNFIYIDDVVRALIKLESVETSNSIINLVGSEPTTIYNLVEKLKEISNCSSKIILSNKYEKAPNVTFDTALFDKLIPFKRTPLYEGLSNEVNYMKNR